MQKLLNCTLFVFIVCISTLHLLLTKCTGLPWTRTVQTKWTNRSIYEFQDIEYGVCFKDGRKFLPSVERESLKNAIQQNPDTAEHLRSLHLTVHTTKFDTEQPVMVHIGGFDLENPTFEKISPKFLLERDIVLVSVKYRTGPTGFLSMRNSHIPGNAAVFDILLALKWVQNSIWKYGGDASRVTLFGQFKAAGLIHVLMLSDLGQKLFHQVILQSGSALLSNFTTKHPVKHSREVGIALECPDVLDKAILTKCLMKASNKDLIEAYNKVWAKHNGNIPFITIGGPSNVLHKDPMEIYQNGKFRTYPKIIGFVDQPSAYFFDFFEKDKRKPGFFSLERFKEDAASMIQYASKIFGQTPMENALPNSSSLAELKNTDGRTLQQTFNLVITSILDWSNLYFKSAVYYTGFLNKTPKTYAYAFKYTGAHHALPNSELLNVAIIKDDDMYLFDQGYDLNWSDTKIAKLMVDLWTSFAETGRPQSQLTPEWPEVKPGSDGYLMIDETVGVGHEYLMELQSAVQTYLGVSDEILFKKFSQ